MTQLETLVRTGLADLAGEARLVDLRARVAASRRRRRTQRRLVAVGLTGAVAASTLGAVTLWPNTFSEPPKPAVTSEPWLPAEIDLGAVTPAALDASLRLLIQATGADGVVHSYGLVSGSNKIVSLPDLPSLPPFADSPRFPISEAPAQLAADGSRLLLQPRTESVVAAHTAPTVIDTRTGAAVDVPWQDDYRAAGLSPDGESIAVATLAIDEPCDFTIENPCTGDDLVPPPTFAPWGLALVDLTSGTERSIALPAGLGLGGSWQFNAAAPPIWSADGRTIEVGLSARYGGNSNVAVSIDGDVALTLADSPLALTPWSPDGTQLILQGTATTAYRVVVADPTSRAAFGQIVMSGPVLGRQLLGWADSDHLLWFDQGASSLVETDLGGSLIGTTTHVIAPSQVTGILLAPAFTP